MNTLRSYKNKEGGKNNGREMEKSNRSITNIGNGCFDRSDRNTAESRSS